MSLLSRLFGGAAPAKPEVEPELYKGFRIFAEPVREAGGFRVAARIEKEIDGEVRSHNLIRADICDSAETAAEMAVRKARMLVDERGDAVLD